MSILKKISARTGKGLDIIRHLYPDAGRVIDSGNLEQTFKTSDEPTWYATLKDGDLWWEVTFHSNDGPQYDWKPIALWMRKYKLEYEDAIFDIVRQLKLGDLSGNSCTVASEDSSNYSEKTVDLIYSFNDLKAAVSVAAEVHSEHGMLPDGLTDSCGNKYSFNFYDALAVSRGVMPVEEYKNRHFIDYDDDDTDGD